MDSMVVCKSVCSPPALFVGPSRGIRNSQCSFILGNTPNFRNISLPRRRDACTIGSSRKSGGALCSTCWDEKILVANRGEIAVRVIRTAHEKLQVNSKKDITWCDGKICIQEVMALWVQVLRQPLQKMKLG